MTDPAVLRRARVSDLRRFATLISVFGLVLSGTLVAAVGAHAVDEATEVYYRPASQPAWPKVSNLVVTGTSSGFTLAFDWEQPTNAVSCPGGVGTSPCWLDFGVYPDLGVYEGTFDDNPLADDFNRGWGLNALDGTDFPDQTIDLGWTSANRPRSGHYTGSFEFDRTGDLVIMLFGGPPVGDTSIGPVYLVAAAELPALSGSSPAVTAPGGFVSVNPARLLDTRVGVGAAAATVRAGQSVDLQVTGRGGVPSSGVSAVVVNVTAVGPSSGGFITAYPSGTSQPTASNLNFSAGQTVPNLVTVKVGANGKVKLTNNSSGTVHLIADVAGYYLSGAVSAP